MTLAIQKAESDVALDVKSVLQDEFARFERTFATKADLAETKAELTRWMFIFWVGQVAAMLAILKLYK